MKIQRQTPTVAMMTTAPSMPVTGVGPFLWAIEKRGIVTNPEVIATRLYQTESHEVRLAARLGLDGDELCTIQMLSDLIQTT